jgi:hypothetical protein
VVFPAAAAQYVQTLSSTALLPSKHEERKNASVFPGLGDACTVSPLRLAGDVPGPPTRRK